MSLPPEHTGTLRATPSQWSGRQLRRLFTAPAIIALTVLVGVTLPVWVVAAAALSPVLPGY